MVEEFKTLYPEELNQVVSIQLVSPASGDPSGNVEINSEGRPKTVSIQLVSPASGDYNLREKFGANKPDSFHSISFPSEWGQSKGFPQIAKEFQFPFN